MVWCVIAIRSLRSVIPPASVRDPSRSSLRLAARAARATRRVTEGTTSRALGAARVSALPEQERRATEHWSGDTAAIRMVVSLRPKGAPPPVYGEFDRCFLFLIHLIWYAQRIHMR